MANSDISVQKEEYLITFLVVLRVLHITIVNIDMFI